MRFEALSALLTLGMNKSVAEKKNRYDSKKI